MKIRAHYIAPLPWFELNAACVTINDSFATAGCYLVGSAMTQRDYRDVDVRCILSDEEYDRLFGPYPGAALWSHMCVTTAAWLSARTGLTIDYQIQRATEANARHSGPRCALGVRLLYPGEVPER